MSRTLNDAQRKLVEDNHNLIYSFLNSRHLSLDATEDWYGTAAIGLCKAALNFDESRGAKFATLAYICMDNEVRMVMRNNRKCIVPDCSLEYEYGEGSGVMSLADIIQDSHDCYYTVYLNDAVQIATRNLSDRDKKILSMIINDGKTHREIAKLYNLSQPTVSRIYGRFIKQIRDYFND